MKVKELIERLQKQDPDLPVVFRYSDSNEDCDWTNYELIRDVYVGKPEDCISDFLSGYAEITKAVIIF